MPDRVRRLVLTALTVAAAVVVVVGLAAGDNADSDRVESIADSLRCPSCQSVSVAEASTPIAREMRQIIADQVAAGRSDAEIKTWFVERYGEWVILDTPARGRTLLLWLLPALGLVFGALAIGSRKRPVAAHPVSDQ